MSEDSSDRRSLAQAIVLGAGIGTGVGIALHSIPIGACIGVGIMLVSWLLKRRLTRRDADKPQR